MALITGNDHATLAPHAGFTAVSASHPHGNMMAAVFVKPGQIALGEKPIPTLGPLDALLRITTTTICCSRTSVTAS